MRQGPSLSRVNSVRQDFFMSDRTPNKYSPESAEIQAALDRVNREVERAVNQKVGRLAQLTVALVQKLGDIDAVITEEELNGAAGWSLELEKLDKGIKLKVAPPPEDFELLAEQPTPENDDASFLL